jgi:hypothetical protein
MYLYKNESDLSRRKDKSKQPGDGFPFKIRPEEFSSRKETREME